MTVHQIIGTVKPCTPCNECIKLNFEQSKLETVFESVELYWKK